MIWDFLIVARGNLYDSSAPFRPIWPINSRLSRRGCRWDSGDAGARTHRPGLGTWLGADDKSGVGDAVETTLRTVAGTKRGVVCRRRSRGGHVRAWSLGNYRTSRSFLGNA